MFLAMAAACPAILSGWSARCARFQQLIAGGSAPAPWVTLLCLPKEESPEERAPPGLRPLTSRVSSRRVLLRGCADATSLSRRRTLAIPRSPLRDCASATRGARLGQVEVEKPCLIHTSSSNSCYANLPQSSACYAATLVPSEGRSA